MNQLSAVLLQAVLGLVLLLPLLLTLPTPHVSRLTPHVLCAAPADLTTTPAWSVTSNVTGTLLGWDVATAGDVNGDGYADVIAGAPRYSNGETEEGVAFLYLGGPDGPADTPAWMGESNQPYSWFGSSVAAAGDVNGDGYGDIIIGAPRYDITDTLALTDTGQAFVYYGGPAGIVTGTLWTAHTDQSLARFGTAVATAGDVNGDGYSDVIITANGYDAEETNEGAAFVYRGGPGGLDATPAWTVHPTGQAFANFGRSASSAGDVNGDGYSDVIIGAPWYDTGTTDEDRDRGAAYVYRGGLAGLSNAPAWTVTGDRREAEFGISVSTAGDVNNDGYSDVIVGAYKYTQDSAHPWREGAAFVYHGGSGGLETSPAWEERGGQESAKFGLAVATAGDMNGDGYTNVAASAYNYNTTYTNTGRVLVYDGGAGGLVGSYTWSAEGDQEGAGLGYAVSTAGDVNGDNYSDLIAGAPTYNDGQMDEGAAFLYLGAGDAGNLLAHPRQLRSIVPAPIAPLGFSDSINRVHLQTTIWPTQTISAKLQWQVAPFDVSFTAPAAISGTALTWTSVPTTGAVLSQTVDGLARDTLYRWRARVLYESGGQSRWLYLPWNGPNEADFRTPNLLEAIQNFYVEPGHSATAIRMLLNPAYVTQTFTLTFISSPGYTFTLALPSGGLTTTLAALESSPVTITAQTHPTTPLGTQFTATITITSDLSGQDTVYHVTTVADLTFLPLVLRNF